MDQLKTKKPARAALGRGLSALISTPRLSAFPTSNQAAEIKLAPETSPQNFSISQSNTDEPQIVARYLDIERIAPNPEQPRRSFKEEELKELADSIRSLGLIQPIIVRDFGLENTYQIIAGERRWKAAKLAGLTQIPAIIDNMAELEVLEVALVENIQRSNLNPVEEALAYKRLSEEFNLTQSEIAEKVGKDRASVANTVRILNLPEQILEMLKEGRISMGHAKAILSVREPSAQISLAKKVQNEELSVRALETLVSRVVVLDTGRKSAASGLVAKNNSALSDSISFPEIVDRLRMSLGTKVTLKHQKSGKGKIEIEYFSEAELERLVESLCK